MDLSSLSRNNFRADVLWICQAFNSLTLFNALSIRLLRPARFAVASFNHENEYSLSNIHATQGFDVPSPYNDCG